MAGEIITTGMEEQTGAPVKPVTAEQLDQQIVTAAAKEQTARTIASLKGDIHDTVQAAVAEGSVTEEKQDTVEGELVSMQSERMTVIGGRSDVTVEDLGKDVLGEFDGTRIALAPDGIDASTFVHERDHERKGLPGENLDAGLAPETGVKAIDKELEKLDMTFRDGLEESAVSAQEAIGERGPEVYMRTHVATVRDLEAVGQEVDVDLKAAIQNLVKTKDVEAFQSELVRAAIQKAIAANEGDTPEVLYELARDAHKAGADDDTREAIVEAAEERYALAA